MSVPGLQGAAEAGAVPAAEPPPQGPAYPAAALPPSTGQPDVDAVLDRAHAAITGLPPEDLEGRRAVLESANRELRDLLESPLAPTSGPAVLPAPASPSPQP